MQKTINDRLSHFFIYFLKFILKKRNKQPFPVGIRSEREKGTSFTPSIWSKEGGELNGAIFF